VHCIGVGTGVAGGGVALMLTQQNFLGEQLVHPAPPFLPRDANAERGYEIAFVCLSVCL